MYASRPARTRTLIGLAILTVVAQVIVAPTAMAATTDFKVGTCNGIANLHNKKGETIKVSGSCGVLSIQLELKKARP